MVPLGRKEWAVLGMLNCALLAVDRIYRTCKAKFDWKPSTGRRASTRVSWSTLSAAEESQRKRPASTLEGLVSLALSTGEALAIEDASQDDRISMEWDLPDVPTSCGSLLVVPLAPQVPRSRDEGSNDKEEVRKSQPCAVLVIARSEGAAFTDADAARLASASPFLAASVQRAIHFERKVCPPLRVSPVAFFYLSRTR